MCTLSWCFNASGYDLFFNRDEKHARSGATGPEPGDCKGIHYLAPRDGQAGGTWLGVNACGVSVALLNYYPVHTDVQEPPKRRSRGRLVLELMDLQHAAWLAPRLTPASLACYPPFMIVAIGPEPEAVTARAWDGHRVEDVPRGPFWPPLSTSSVATAEVVAARYAAYGTVVGPGPATTDRLLAYHASHDPGSGAHSVCVHREDAGTVSFSRIAVTNDRARFEYHPGPPCRRDAAQGVVAEL